MTTTSAKTLLFLILGFTLSYTPPLIAQNDLDFINALNSDFEREHFLLQIRDLDQSIRLFEDSVMLTEGWRSVRHIRAIQSLTDIDSLNTIQIDRYLDVHGYPDQADFEEEARITPWLVLIHSQNEEIRQKQFSKLYNAYKEENLESRRFLLFLEDEYQKEFNKNYKSYSQGDRRIQELIKELQNARKEKKQLRFP